MKIIIGKEYEKSFESIKNLRECLPDLIDIDDDGAIIEKSSGNRYMIDSSKSIFNDSTIAYVDEDGASWFSELRGEPSRGDDASAWINFIDLVATTYHKKYSLLEFKQVKKESTVEEDGKNYELIKRFIKFFKKDYLLYSPCFISEKPVVSPKDIYILNLKVSVDSEAGEAKTILAKLYFTRQANRYRPLPINETIEIEENMKNVFNNDSESIANNERNFIVDEILTEFDLLVKNESIEKYFVFSGNDDVKAFNMLLKSGPVSGVDIRCNDIKINTISHIIWNDLAYFIKYEGKNILKFVFDSKGNLSLYCVNCTGEEVLVYNNEIMLDEKRLKDNGYDLNTKAILNNDEENYGLDDKLTVCAIKCAKLHDHVVQVNCPWIISDHSGCRKIKCMDSLFSFDGNNYCKDCVYPEIVTSLNDTFYPTNKLEYVSNTVEKLAFINDSTEGFYHKCSICGRTIRHNVKEDYATYYCDNCASLLSVNESNHKVYKQFADYLPLSIRLAGLFKEKCAYENDELVTFRIGNKYYYFEKYDVVSNKQVKIKKGGK